MSTATPELVLKSAEKALRLFCASPLQRGSFEYRVSAERCTDGFHLTVTPAGHKTSRTLARLLFIPELGQWTAHRPRSNDRWSYVPEAGGALDLNRLLRYIREDPLNIFWIF